MQSEDMRVALAEFIATFTLIFVGSGSVVLHEAGQLDLTGVALAHGLAVATMVAVTLPISGGLMNPAVALSLWVTGLLPGKRAGIAIVAELLGAVAGALVLRALIPDPLFGVGLGGIPVLGEGLGAGKGTLLEATMTFFLVFVFFGSCLEDRDAFSNTAGLGVGLVVTIGMLAFAPFTGAAMNPARWIGPAIATGNFSAPLVWVVGPIAGGIIAGVVYRSAFLQGREPSSP